MIDDKTNLTRIALFGLILASGAFAAKYLDSQLALLPQGKPEKKERAEKMVAQMDAEGFGACTNTGACEAECPKAISLTNIARMNREYFSAVMSSYEVQSKGGD